MARSATKLPRLPKLLDRKIYKTGQTRGADDDVIFQNRVGRNSTVLIPFRFLDVVQELSPRNGFENGAIVLISPDDYRALGVDEIARRHALAEMGIPLGIASLVFFEKRVDWLKLAEERSRWTPATSRIPPLGGEFVARIASTTRGDDERINLGFTTTALKGAGIRVYEYAGTDTINACRLQLEALYWLANDACDASVEAGMTPKDAEDRQRRILDAALANGLLELDRLRDIRALDHTDTLSCPLCREQLSARGFVTRLQQAEGREVHDLTVTSLNLFHVEELRVSALNHRPYNLAWGCHHCNVVTKDSGIEETLSWMLDVLRRNGRV